MLAPLYRLEKGSRQKTEDLLKLGFYLQGILALG